MKYVCEILNTTCTYVPVKSLDERLTAVADGKADFGISSITVTPKRAEIVDFVKPYYYSAGVSLYDAESGVDLASGGWEGLRGKTVCSEAGYYYNEIFPSKYGINIKVMDWNASTTHEQQDADVAAAVKDGSCVGYLSDSFTEKAANSQLPPLEVEPYGIVVSKSNPELRRQLSAALVEAMGSGADSEILKLEAQEVVAKGVAANDDLPVVVAAVSDFDTTSVTDVKSETASTPAPSSPTSSAAALKSAVAAVACVVAAAVAI